MEEEENAQTEEQKKDEAEVQGNWSTTQATEGETSEAGGQGRWYKLLSCMPAVSNLSPRVYGHSDHLHQL